MARPISGPFEAYREDRASCPQAVLRRGSPLGHQLPRFLGCSASCFLLARTRHRLVCSQVCWQAGAAARLGWPVPSSWAGSSQHRHQLPAPSHRFPRVGDRDGAGHHRLGKLGVRRPVLPRHGEALGAGKKPAADTAEMSLPLSQPAGEPPFPKAFLFLAAPP